MHSWFRKKRKIKFPFSCMFLSLKASEWRLSCFKFLFVFLSWREREWNMIILQIFCTFFRIKINILNLYLFLLPLRLVVEVLERIWPEFFFRFLSSSIKKENLKKLIRRVYGCSLFPTKSFLSFLFCSKINLRRQCKRTLSNASVFSVLVKN